MREAAELLALPEFDSLPATAGLTNEQAFRLSIRRALALLPAMLAQEGGFRRMEDIERFVLH